MTRLAVTLMIAAAGFGPGMASARAAPGPVLRTTWVTDGPVTAIAPGPHGVTYIGGSFSLVGPRTGAWVAINGATGARDAGWPEVSGTATAITPDGVGGWYVGGDFLRVAGETRRGLAHIRSDRTLGPDWNAEPTTFDGEPEVSALVLSGGVVYISGDFRAVAGQERPGVAALDAATGELAGWKPDLQGSANTLAVASDTVYVGGELIDGPASMQTTDGLAAFDAVTAARVAFKPGVNGAVKTLAVADGMLYVGGSFSSIGGLPRSRLGAIEIATGQLSAWHPLIGGADGVANVSALAIVGGVVYAGGAFASAGGLQRRNLVALDAATGTPTAANLNTDGPVAALASAGAVVYAAGEFTEIAGRERDHLASLDAPTGTLTQWGPRANGPVHALALDGVSVYAGGAFTSIGAIRRRHLAALDAAGTATAWDPRANGGVTALIFAQGRVFVGGGFTRVGARVRRHLAALDPVTGRTTAWNPDANRAVRALAARGARIYAAGEFTTIGPRRRARLAAVDAHSGRPTAWNPRADATVTALTVRGHTIYAAGDYEHIGSHRRRHAAAIDALTGRLTEFNPDLRGAWSWDNDQTTRVETIATQGRLVYLGGEFTSVNGRRRSGLAAIDAVSGRVTAWHVTSSGTVKALAAAANTLYVGGALSSMAKQPRSGLAAISAPTATPLDWAPDLAAPLERRPVDHGEAVYVSALATRGNTVYVGGGFTTVDGHPQQGIALFST